jgi:excisionase family DNA binding protein
VHSPENAKDRAEVYQSFDKPQARDASRHQYSRSGPFLYFPEHEPKGLGELPTSTESQRRRYASLAAAAEYLDCNQRTIRHLIASGRLTGYRFGPRIIRIDLNEVDDAMRPIPTVKAG